MQDGDGSSRETPFLALRNVTLLCSAGHINIAHCTAKRINVALYIKIVHTAAPCINQRSASVQECCTGGGVSAQPAIQVEEEGAAAAHSLVLHARLQNTFAAVLHGSFHCCVTLLYLCNAQGGSAC